MRHESFHAVRPLDARMHSMRCGCSRCTPPAERAHWRITRPRAIDPQAVQDFWRWFVGGLLFGAVILIGWLA